MIISGPDIEDVVIPGEGSIGYRYALPCEGYCTHAWCPVTRVMAAGTCYACGHPYGFLVDLVSFNFELIHRRCLPASHRWTARNLA